METPKTLGMTAQCLCKRHTFTRTGPPAAAFPLRAVTCHCASCRRVTGALSGSRAVLWSDDGSECCLRDKDDPNPSLREYQFSDTMTLMFCSRCSSPIFVRDASETKVKNWVCTGVLQKHASRTDVMDWGTHVFVGDTVDGGASNWLGGKKWLGKGGMSELVEQEEGKEGGGYWPPIFVQGKEEEERVINDLKAGELPGEVKLGCRCGGVDLLVKAGEAQREFEKLAKEGRGKLPWFVDPVTHKSVGTFDGCDSCRIWSGVEVFNWTFFLLKHVGFGDGSEGFPTDTAELKAAVGEGERREVKVDAKFGTLAYYASSPDVQRYFCSRCAACVFYCIDDRPDMVDVAVGLLHAPEGARAESIISWELGGEIGWREDMEGTWRENLLNTVEKEAEEWRVKRGYPKSWRRAAREAGDVQSE